MAKDGTLKLTKTGAQAVRAWMDRHSVTLAALAVAAGLPHQMAASRALKLEGRLTLEQVGKLVSHAAGELTAAQLVGMELAAAVPVVPSQPPPVASPPSPPPSVVAAPPPALSGAPIAVAVAPLAGDLDEAFDATAKQATLEALTTATELMKGSQSEHLRLKCAALVIEHGRGRARQAEKSEGPDAPLAESILMDRLLFTEAQLARPKRADKLDSDEFYGEGLA